jgi:DEAD/DEAH box helicase domain-containing protein
VFTHSALRGEQVKCASIAAIIDEAFLMSLPFERQDVSAAADRHRATRDGVTAGDRFICIYDQTYGSLRLTSHLMNTEVLREVFARACEIARLDPNFRLPPETFAALESMAACVELEPEEVVGAAASGSTPDQFVPVIMPGSMGIDTHKDNEEFEITAVFYSPILARVAYRGHYVSSRKKVQAANHLHSATTVIVRADHIQPLTGESGAGYFNLETGEITTRLPLPGEF